MENRIDPIRELIIEAIRSENIDTDNFQIPSPLDQNLKTLMSMRSDLEFAIKAIEELIRLTNESQRNDVIKTALWQSCVITYCKCFTNGNKAGHFSLDPNSIFRDSNDLRSIHEEVSRVRNEFIAHRGDNEYEHIVVFYSQTKANIVGPKAGHFNMKALRANNLSVEDFELYKKTFIHALGVVMNKLLIQGTKIRRKLLSDGGKEIVKWRI